MSINPKTNIQNKIYVVLKTPHKLDSQFAQIDCNALKCIFKTIKYKYKYCIK